MEAEDTNSEAENQKSESARSSISKEEEKYEKRSQGSPQDKMTVNNKDNEAQALKTPEQQGQQIARIEEKGMSRGKSGDIKIPENKHTDENKDIKRTDVVGQQVKGRSGAEQKQEQPRLEERKPEASKEVQESERLKQEQDKIKKQKELQQKQVQEEERKSHDVKRQAEESLIHQAT